MNRRARRQRGQVVLLGPDLVREPERVQRAEQGAETVLHHGGNRIRGQQPCARGFRCVIALAHTGPSRIFSASLNAGWNTFSNRRDTEYY